MPFFANWGQIAQIVFAGLAFVFTAIKAWPDMKGSEFLTTGAFAFYSLIALVLVMLTRRTLGTKSAGTVPSESRIGIVETTIRYKEGLSYFAVKK